LKKFIYTGLLVRKTIYLKQKIQEIYSEKLVCVQTILMWGKNNVLDKKKTVFLKRRLQEVYS
jgi:hypothetical protein